MSDTSTLTIDFARRAGISEAEAERLLTLSREKNKASITAMLANPDMTVDEAIVFWRGLEMEGPPEDAHRRTRTVTRGTVVILVLAFLGALVVLYGVWEVLTLVWTVLT